MNQDVEKFAQDAKRHRPYLRKRQVDALTDEKQRLESVLGRQDIQDRNAARRELKRVNFELETGTPPVLNRAQEDYAVKRARHLRDQIRHGMLSQEEMRKCPPGAIGQHQRWEKDTKTAQLEYKNLVTALNRESDDPDVASIERFRPTTSTLSMDNALVPGKAYSLPSEAFKENYDAIFHKEGDSAQTEPESDQPLSAEGADPFADPSLSADELRGILYDREIERKSLERQLAKAQEMLTENQKKAIAGSAKSSGAAWRKKKREMEMKREGVKRPPTTRADIERAWAERQAMLESGQRAVDPPAAGDIVEPSAPSDQQQEA